MSLLDEVVITTYINPHLFWVIQNNKERTETLKRLDGLIKTCSHLKHDTNDAFEIGEMVSVEINNKYYRAIIKDINNEGTSRKNAPKTYLCWLIDYGQMCKAENIFKSSIIIRKTPPLALQASINEVCYVKQHLQFDKYGKSNISNKNITTPTPMCRQISIDLLSNSQSMQFKLETKHDGIIFGDILYKEKETDALKSLREGLIEKAVLSFDKELFEEIKESIKDYKDKHTLMIADICRNTPSSIESIHTNNSDALTSCEVLIFKYLNEFEEIDVTDERDILPLSNRKRSKNITSNPSDTVVASESESPKKPDTISPSRRKLLLELIDKRRNSTNGIDTHENSKLVNIDECKDEHESDSGCGCTEPPALKIDSSSSGSITNEMETHRPKLVDIDKCNNKHEPDSGSSCTESPAKKMDRSFSGLNRATGRKIIFTAAGAERSWGAVRKNTSNVKKQKSYVTTNSSEDLSSDRRKRTTPENGSLQSTGFSNNTDEIKITSAAKESDEMREHREKDAVSSECDSDQVRKNPNHDLKGSDNESSSSTSVQESSLTLNVSAPNQLKIKPHCSCKQCELWTKEEDLNGHLCEKRKSEKKILDGKPHTLRRAKDEEVKNGVDIISLDYSSMTKIEKQSVSKLLIHSVSLPKAVTLVSDVNFHRDIHKSMSQLEYKIPKRVQSYTWPAMFRNQHICMVHGPKTGKTMAYLPVICTFILERNDRYTSLLKVAGSPIAMILCGNSKKCEEVYDLVKILLGKNRAKVSLISYPITYVNTSHVDLLISTPPILMDLLKSKAINFKRLCHLILEDGDTILNRHFNIMNTVLDLAESMLNNRLHSKGLQMIICAEHWNFRIENLLKSLQQTPLVCIANYLEAALYGKMLFSIRFMSSACKEQELKTLLKENYKIYRSIIVCREDEIEDLQTILMLKGIESQIISPDLSKEEVLYLENVWTVAKGGEYTVLVCTDFSLSTLLTVTSASLLIHYSLPISWTKFIKRFSCLLEHCSSPLSTKEQKTVPQSVVLCDENCEEQMHKFFNYIDTTELKKLLPDKLKSYSKELRNLEERDKLKNEIGLCEKLKLFGKCDEFRCKRRHVLNKKLDVSDHLPHSGKLKFKIFNFEDVSTFSMRILQHINCENEIRHFDNASDVTEDLTATLKICRKKASNPRLGHLYAFYDVDEADDVYRRCELLEIDPDCVKIRLLEKGTVISTIRSRLYKLPKEFGNRNQPRTIMVAYLADYAPPYQDDNFSSKSFFKLKNMLEKFDYTNLIFVADIHLQLGHSYWLKNVYEEITLTDKVIPGFQLTREILKAKLVEHDPNQLIHLYDLCDKAGIEVPTFANLPTRITTEEENVAPQWAHLDMENVNEVIFSAAISPDEVYVRLNKYSDLLYTLQKEIQNSIKKPNYPKLQEVKVGGIYLAKDVEGLEYARVVVSKMENEKALCFFVDFGDEAVVPLSELKFIMSKFIRKLPFQSIQCRLHGLKPISDEWQSDVTDVLYSYAVEPQTDIFRYLYVKCCAKETSQISQQNKYSVLIKDGFGERNVLINQLLIECGLAMQNSEGISDFEIPDGSETYESNEELECLMDICRKTEEVEENFHPHNGDHNINEDNDFEFYVDDPLKFFEEILSMNMNRQTSEPSNSTPRELPAPHVVAEVSYSTPDVFWYQSEGAIKLNIKLSDVVDYKLSLTKGRILHFRTIKNEKTYILKLMLYDTVDSMQHTLLGPEIRITLIKGKLIEWPRLILSKQRTRNIHYDVTKIKVDCGEHKKFLELPKVSDDEKDSDDGSIDMMYHVVSDMDSDMDEDLPVDSD